MDTGNRKDNDCGNCRNWTPTTDAGRDGWGKCKKTTCPANNSWTCDLWEADWATTEYRKNKKQA